MWPLACWSNSLWKPRFTDYVAALPLKHRPPMPFVVVILNLHNFGRNKSLMSIFLKPHHSTFATNLCYCLQAFFNGDGSLSYSLNCPQASACWINTSVQRHQRPQILSSIMLQAWFAVLKVFISVAHISWGTVCLLVEPNYCVQRACSAKKLWKVLFGGHKAHTSRWLCALKQDFYTPYLESPEK